MPTGPSFDLEQEADLSAGGHSDATHDSLVGDGEGEPRSEQEQVLGRNKGTLDGWRFEGRSDFFPLIAFDVDARMKPPSRSGVNAPVADASLNWRLPKWQCPALPIKRAARPEGDFGDLYDGRDIQPQQQKAADRELRFLGCIVGRLTLLTPGF